MTVGIPNGPAIRKIRKIVEVQIPIGDNDDQDWDDTLKFLSSVYPSSCFEYVSDKFDGPYRIFHVEVQP